MYANRDLLKSVTLMHTSVFTWVRNHTHATHATRDLVIPVVLRHRTVFTQTRDCTLLRDSTDMMMCATIDLLTAVTLRHTSSLTHVIDHTHHLLTEVDCF